MTKKIIVLLSLVAGVLVVCYLSVTSFSSKQNRLAPLWVEDLLLELDVNKDQAIEMIDKITTSYDLKKEFLSGPSDLVGDSKHFYHYRSGEHIVVTVHDLKGSGTKLTIYFYGLKNKNVSDSLSGDLRSSLDELVRGKPVID